MGRRRLIRVLIPAARWLLVCLLLSGVVGMHHFAPTPAPNHHVVAVSNDMPHPESPAHDLMHLCVAVLFAVSGLMAAAVLLGALWTTGVTPLRTWRHIARVDRPPSTGGRDLLSAVCVLRL